MTTGDNGTGMMAQGASLGIFSASGCHRCHCGLAVLFFGWVGDTWTSRVSVVGIALPETDSKSTSRMVVRRLLPFWDAHGWHIFSGNVSFREGTWTMITVSKYLISMVTVFVP